MLLLLALLLSVPSSSASGRIPWDRDYKRATVDARERRAPLLVLFLKDDCAGGFDAAGATDHRGRPGGRAHTTDCNLMEEDVLSHRDVVAQAARFVPVLAGEGVHENLYRRYEVAVVPTVLFADPWGNEIVRLVGYVPRDRFLRVMRAIPDDFAKLGAAGTVLAEDPGAFDAWLSAAGFYEAAGLREISDRYYGKALGTSRGREDVESRRQATLARGLNLLRVGKAEDAARLFADCEREAPEAPLSDALLLGVVMARIEAGQRRQAEAVVRDMEARFPASAYTRRAREAVSDKR